VAQVGGLAAVFCICIFSAGQQTKNGQKSTKNTQKVPKVAQKWPKITNLPAISAASAVEIVLP
jgi:hypothetical protein